MKEGVVFAGGIVLTFVCILILEKIEERRELRGGNTEDIGVVA